MQTGNHRVDEDLRIGTRPDGWEVALKAPSLAPRVRMLRIATAALGVVQVAIIACVLAGAH